MQSIEENRRTVSLICMGTDIYMVTLYVSQFIIVSSLMLLEAFIPELSDSYDSLEGLAAIAQVFLGCIMLYCFAADKRDRGQLFGDHLSFGSAVFGRRRRITLTAFAVMAALIVLSQTLSSLVLELTEIILNRFGMTVTNSPAMNADYSLSAMLLLYAVIIGPLAEELVFRGFILKGLEPCGRVFAIVVSAVMFSLMHGDIQQTFFTFIVGLILGYAACEYSIWISFLLHVFNNGILSGILDFMDRTLPEEVCILIALLVVVLCIVLTIMFFIRHRQDIADYISENRTQPGAVRGLLNRWFAAYAVFCIAETVFTVTPL